MAEVIQYTAFMLIKQIQWIITSWKEKEKPAERAEVFRKHKW